MLPFPRSRWSPALRRSKFDIIPDAQKCLQCELESLKSQLQAQTKALGFLKQSVTTLEKQMRLQQIKIQQLEEAQEEEITENLVNIQKMKKTPVKCGKVLARMKKQDSEASNWSDTEEMPQGDSGSWRDDLQKAISDIWPQGALMPEPSTLLMGLRLRMGPGPFPAIIQQEPLLPTCLSRCICSPRRPLQRENKVAKASPRLWPVVPDAFCA
ncbi:Coiled-coil domain-containing protein 159 [Manis javanica]|nr:Coiled-coil domain-containing protein 159 [Manis javanica]